MFCPECKCEYREGFTRCGSCEVDLVADLSVVEHGPPAGAGAGAGGPAPVGPPVDYCGFLDLDDARQARDRLRADRVPSEIVIRDLAAGRPETPPQEEYWLLVPKDAVRRVAALLGDLQEASSASTPVSCSECGKDVGAEERFCPHCGARFD